MVAIDRSVTSARTQNYVRALLRPPTRHHDPDWRKYHCVVFESDDWGLCGEGKDRATHDRLASLGYDMYSESSRRVYANTLEREEDLDTLYKTLRSYRDRLGRNPVFTANFVVANPSFSSIAKSGFREYHYVPITDGFPSTWGFHKPVVEGWRRGIRDKLMVPEYHGFSHFNYRGWLEGLRRGDRRLKAFFEEEMFTTSAENPTISEYGAASVSMIQYLSFTQQFSIITRGREIFKGAFGSYPKTTIPPNDVSSPQTLAGFAKAGIGFVQSERRKISSILGLRPPVFKTPVMVMARVLMQLMYITRMYRNVRLENGEDSEDSALELSKRIGEFGSPVIVGTHRQNYVGRVEPGFADRGIRRLATYLKGLSEDPRLTFLSSSEAFQLSSIGHSMEKFGDEFLIRNYRRGDLTVFLPGVGRHSLRALLRENSGGAHSKPVEGGSKVFVPAGREVSLTVET